MRRHGIELRLALSERQREILDLLAEGLVVKQIGVRLCISQFTVQTHLRTAYARLGARNAAHAVALHLKGRTSQDYTFKEWR